MMLKLDIVRVFDLVSWSFLFQILSHLGFGPRWREWISILLSMASTRVLVNGVPSTLFLTPEAYAKAICSRRCFSLSSSTS